MNGLRNALAFLTRLPTEASKGIPFGTGARPGDIAAAIPWFPAVGWLVGAAVALVYAVLAAVLPGVPAATAAVATGVLITGALHEDGLGDVADAFGEARDRDETLRILRDAHLGTYGVLAVTAAFLLRTGAVAALDPWAAAAALPAAHALSRAAAITPTALLPPAAEGLGATYGRAATGGHVAVAIALALALGAATLGPWAAPAAVAAALGAVAPVRVAATRIGGLTGDVLGAAQQGAEVAILLLAAAVAHNGWAPFPWWR